MQQTVYFTGTLPRKSQTPYGGGEVGNVRTIHMLERYGYKVVTIRRLKSNAKESWLQRMFGYPLRTIVNLVNWFVVLLFGTRKNGIAYVSGFYGKTIYVETLQVFIAKLLGFKIVYELRGGGATKFYNNGSKLYRKQFQYILNQASYLLSQGRENEPLLRSLCNTPVFYYPNYVLNDFYPESISPRNDENINLLFFGRIEDAKNPQLIIYAASLLQKAFNNITLTMLGNGQTELLEKVKRLMQETLQPGTWQLLPGCSHDKLKTFFVDKHFYIFPSQQEREGQSNAITEAMSYGIIPIASPQGFSRSTIGDDYLIIDELSSEAYAKRIADIIKEKKIEMYSQFVRERFLNNFTEKVVFGRMKSVCEMFFK